MVFGVLAFCTVLMVGSYYLPISSTAVRVTIAMAVAVCEAFMVAGVLMHLLTERKLIYGVLLLTAVFFALLFILPICADLDHTKRFFH